MTSRGPISIFRLALLAAALGSIAAVAPAASRSGDDAISLVPADAASVAVVRLSELRTSPLASKLFADADRMTLQGDAARFLEETHLRPTTDVDTVVVAGLPPSSTAKGGGVAFFSGRFDPERLASAAVERGAVRKHSPAGDYYLLPEKNGSPHEGKPNAVAFVDPTLIIAGSESNVVNALATRRSGGSGFASGTGLGRHLSRIDRGSAVWALVDVARYPGVRRSIEKGEGSAPSEPSAVVLSAMKSVTLVAFEATPRADALALSATGLCSDEDTRSLLEDSLRGVLAMWRLATQEKSPELVSALRQFRVNHNNEGVTISGVLPGSVIRSLAEKKHSHP